MLLFLGFKYFLKAGTSPSAGGEWGSNSIWAPLFKLPISDQLAQAPGKGFSHPELLRILSASSNHFLIIIQPQPWMFSYCIRFYQPKRFHEASFTFWSLLNSDELLWRRPKNCHRLQFIFLTSNYQKFILLKGKFCLKKKYDRIEGCSSDLFSLYFDIFCRGVTNSPGNNLTGHFLPKFWHILPRNIFKGNLTSELC